MKKIVLLCVIMTTLIISGCNANNSSTSKNYTYENLDDTQKQIIDTVFDENAKWDYVQDSGNTRYCSKINFFYEGDNLLFIAEYNLSSVSANTISSSAFSYRAFYVDDSGHLTSREYSPYQYEQKRAAEGHALGGLDFSKDNSKNTLSNAYYKAYLSHNNK